MPQPRLIPTNVITGFLGVGKTTAILHLLRHNRGPEKWAVLVNEFGEIGIDGALLQTEGVAIREVPGGCMCCATGLPTQIALNQLIQQTRPDRILIEPTGLGHPANILNMLTGEQYDDVLEVRATLTLVDPRVLGDARYTGNENFIGQVAAADVLIAAKTDLCDATQLDSFAHWANEQRPDASVQYVQNGELQAQWLDLPRSAGITGSPHQTLSLLTLTPQFARLQLGANEPFLRRENNQGGFFSCGWIFQPDSRFVFDSLFQLLNNLDVLRAKAVMKTDRGIFAFNLADSTLTVSELTAATDSRIEFIGPEPISWHLLEGWLLQARQP